MSSAKWPIYLGVSVLTMSSGSNVMEIRITRKTATFFHNKYILSTRITLHIAPRQFVSVRPMKWIQMAPDVYFQGYLQTVHDICHMHVAVTGRWYWSYQGIEMDLKYGLVGL